MTTCVHKSHHRPEVRALTKSSLFRWLASCPCGWAKGTSFWRQAIIAANIHAESIK